ncbi:MAG: peptidylprolyl isomerase, partial [Muribaculaceae bacterium]|nr:peptidylprolyl isomerase [Muribaculaceae bacterium]
MKKHLLAAVMAAVAVLPALAKDADPVLLTVDGHDVRVSEFEYLYNKNKSQQLQPQTIDEYLQMFIEYKLKVADAERAGLQNTPEFRSEYNKYQAELAAPYMVDKAVEDSLLHEAYEHRKYDVLVSHIMLERKPGNDLRLDSIRTAIESGATTFEVEARRHSIDRGSSARGGLMGMVTPDRFPYSFENAAYNTAVGAISPVTDSGMGYHIIRVEKKTPAEGEVEASHILRLTQGRTPEQAAAERRLIDSIYTLVKGGADFAELARKYSEDPGSARMGGSLGWFSRGMMVAEFDSVAFALADGAVSEPFATTFGYHIVKRSAHRGIPSYEEAWPEIKNNFSRDERANLPRQARIAKYIADYKGAVNENAMAEARKAIEA